MEQTSYKIGYARVSTKEQNLDLQIDALKRLGCSDENIYREKVSGAKRERPELDKMLSQLRRGDTVYIYKLDRLGRSMKHLLELIEEFNTKGVNLESIEDKISTSSIQGRLVLNIFASLAEFERDLIRERTMAGLESARARGKTGGRPAGLTKEAERTAMAAETLYREGKLGINEIADQLTISKATLYKYLRYRNVTIGEKR